MAKEINEEGPNSKIARKRSNTLDLYDEELAKKAVGRLFEEAYEEDELEDDAAYDDDDVPAEEYADDDSFVTGYDKPKTIAKVPKEIIPEDEDEEEYEDEDYDEPEPIRRRPRNVTPAPRPAVKVNTPASARTRSTAASRPRTSVRVEDELDEDGYDSFRQRPKSKEAGSTSTRRYAESERRPRTETRERIETERARSVRDYEDEDGEISNVARWVGAVVIFIFLVILVFLVYRLNVVSGELKDANDKLATSSTSDAEFNQLKVNMDKLEQQLLEKDNTIEQLTNEIALLQPSQPPDVPQVNNSGTPPTTTVTNPPATTNSNTLPTVYTVVSGDSLSKISKLYYGDMSLANINKIKAANGMTKDDISIGQKLTIPE